MRRRAARWVRLAVVLVIVGALAAFAFAVDWSDAWRAMRQASPGVLAVAALVNLLSILVKAVRWWIFLRPIGVTSPWLAIRGTFIGAGLNNLLIANGGEVARVVFVARVAHQPSARVLATLALERFFEIVGYVVLLAAAVSLLDLPGLRGMRVTALALLAAAAVAVAWLLRRPERAEVALLPAGGRGLLRAAREYGRSFVQSLTAISTPQRFGGALACSLVVWTLQVATYHLTARAAHVELPLIATVAAVLAVNTGFAVRATPGNLGVFQMLYAVTVAAFGVDRDVATGVALLIQVQQVVPVTVIGVALAPELIVDRRERARVGTVLPGEAAPPETAG